MKIAYLKRILLLWLVIQIMFSFQALAQTTITSRIVNSAGSVPLVGISVQVEGKVMATATDQDGSFSLYVNDAPPVTLIISSVGFATNEIVVTRSCENLDIHLDEKSIM